MSEEQKRQPEGFYSKFVGDLQALAAQARDAKVSVADLRRFLAWCEFQQDGCRKSMVLAIGQPVEYTKLVGAHEAFDEMAEFFIQMIEQAEAKKAEAEKAKAEKGGE